MTPAKMPLSLLILLLVLPGKAQEGLAADDRMQLADRWVYAGIAVEEPAYLYVTSGYHFFGKESTASYVMKNIKAKQE
jgi:hypothetical protein